MLNKNNVVIKQKNSVYKNLFKHENYTPSLEVSIGRSAQTVIFTYTKASEKI